VESGSYFIISNPLGPTLAEALRLNLLTQSDKIKVAIELMKVISVLHEKGFLLNHVCPENISFAK
jgi:hypothetical protein